MGSTKCANYRHHEFTWMESPHPIMKCITMALGIVGSEVELFVNTSTHIADVALHMQMRWDNGKLLNKNLCFLSWKVNLNCSNPYITEMIEATSWDSNEWMNDRMWTNKISPSYANCREVTYLPEFSSSDPTFPSWCQFNRCDHDCWSCQLHSIACVCGHHSIQQLQHALAAWLGYQFEKIILIRKRFGCSLDPIGK